MNTIFLSGLSATPTQVTGVSTLFTQATFFEATAFNAGVPTFGTGNLFLGYSSGVQPIKVGASGNYVVNVNTLELGENNLSSYWVSPQFVGDGLVVVFA
jgi:hypothetical protein